MIVNAEKLQVLINEGWTKSDFAERAQISRNTLDRILKTGIVHRHKHLSGILRVLGLTQDDINVQESGLLIKESIKKSISRANSPSIYSKLEANTEGHELELLKLRVEYMERELKLKDELINVLKLILQNQKKS